MVQPNEPNEPNEPTVQNKSVYIYIIDIIIKYYIYISVSCDRAHVVHCDFKHHIKTSHVLKNHEKTILRFSSKGAEPS